MMRVPILPILIIVGLALLAAGCSAPERSALPPYQPGGPSSLPATLPAAPPASPSAPPAALPAPSPVPPKNPSGHSAVPPEPVPLPPDTVIPQPPLPAVPAPAQNIPPSPPASNSPSANASGNASLNSSSPSNSSSALPSAICSGLSGQALVTCVQTLAVSRHDVSVCVDSIGWKDLRYQCITYWCSSSGRDYNQCQNLRDYDARTGCLNKCNPNSNT